VRRLRRAVTIGLALALGAACKADAPSRRPAEAAERPPDAVQGHALVFTRGDGQTRAPAYALTASDGTGLRLAYMHVQAAVQGPLALTQVRLAFDNLSGRTIEGRFDVTLPEGAAISRFAMKIGDAWQEGEVVERLKATQIYETFLHRGVDPALLEHDAGERFRARVFPIPGRSRKELIISYTQELADPREPYRLPLLGLPHLDALYVQLFVAGADGADRRLTLTRSDYVPEGDLVLREVPERPTAGVRHGSIVAARVALVAEPGAAAKAAKQRAAGWTLLLDTSASQAVGFAGRVRGLKPLIAELGAREGRDVHVDVIGFDQERFPIYSGPSSGFGDAQVERAIARGALGASDPAAALREATRAARQGARIVLVGDGIATLGAAGALPAAAADARAAGVARIDAVVGTTSDRAMLRALTAPQDAGATAGGVIDGDLPAGALADKLRAPILGGVEVVVPNSRWVWPRRLDGVQPGDLVVVYAEIDEGVPMRVLFKGAPLREQVVTTATVERPLLERAWRGAQLRELVAEHDALAEADARRAGLRAKIVDLSIAHRVLSPFTALLVLETEDDYKRFQLDRRALSDILVVGDDGLDVLHRDLATTLAGAGRSTDGKQSSVQAEPGPQVPAPPSPLQDTDRDGVPDDADRCPMSPEDIDGSEDWDGCPDLLYIDNCQIKLADRVYFGTGSTVVPPKAYRALDEVKDTLNAAPDIALWIEGHTDHKERRPRKSAIELSQRRVDAVRDWLVKKGIDPIRLEPKGWGHDKPIDTNRTAEGRANNRRVEFNLKQCRRSWDTQKGWHRARASGLPALEGRLHEVEEALARDPAGALKLARAWWTEQPGDVLAAIALGRALAATGARQQAARAFGSLIDLSPSRAELRRHAGQRLEALGAIELAVDTYRQAVLLRPDHPTSHRLLGLALARLGRYAEAFAALEVGRAQNYPRDRFPGIEQIFAEDLTIVGAAWIRSEPGAEPEVKRRLAAQGLTVAGKPSLRFVLMWETDVADVDVHLIDARGVPQDPYKARVGWTRQVDNRAGFGPEPLIVDDKAREYPYTVSVHYASRSAMGHAMGAVQVIEHDGHGRLGFATLPFVLMREGAALDIGAVTGPLVEPARP
jgi:outer membrane protein OmpA-like peptidoglycan-associated protein